MFSQEEAIRKMQNELGWFPQSSHILPTPKELHKATTDEKSKLEKFVKKAAPYAAGLASFIPGVGWVAGPIAGAAVGASQRGKGNKLKGALSGAAKGAVVPAVHSAMSGGLGGLARGLGGMLPDMIGGALGGGGDHGVGSEMEQPQQQPQMMHQGHGSLSNFAPETPQQEQPDILALIQAGLSPLDILAMLSPNSRNKKKRPLETFVPTEGKKYAHGGFVGHIKESNTGGQADDIPKEIPENSYVLNATDISLLGDGSTDNGIKQIDDFRSKFERSGITKPTDSHSRAIAAKVSNDEYVLPPEVVTAIGNGDNNKGAKNIDKMRSNLRKHKGVAKILPPKSKSIDSYFKGGR